MKYIYLGWGPAVLPRGSLYKLLRINHNCLLNITIKHYFVI